MVPCKFTESPATVAKQLDVQGAAVPPPAELRILIVEDDELNCLVMKTSLEVGFRIAAGTKAHITTTHTAEDALKVIGDTSDIEFDVVVADQHMELAGGVLKGAELIERLVARNFARRPVLVVVSADTDELERAAYLASGADIVWPKPYPKKALLVKDILQVWNGERRCKNRQPELAGRKASSKVVPTR